MTLQKRKSKTKWFVKLHHRLIKPPFPVDIRCPACGHWLTKVNSDTIEISNDHGVSIKELKAGDSWNTVTHGCGAVINLYWKV